jgi:hypothetical protein
MSRIKNEQPGSVAAMIIPIKASITMDGFSGVYPFQLFTINENMLPYRYSSANLNNGKVAFSTARITHNFSNNEWVTSMEGFMTFLNSSDVQTLETTVQPTTSINTAAAAPVLPYRETVQKVINALKAAGFSKAVAAGFLGNMEEETHFNNAIVFSNSPDPANKKQNFGLIQWQGPRNTALRNSPGGGNTIESQIGFIVKELNSAYPKAKTGIASIQDSESGAARAATILRDDYVKPSDDLIYRTAYEARITNAVEFYKQIQNGTYLWP